MRSSPSKPDSYGVILTGKCRSMHQAILVRMCPVEVKCFSLSCTNPVSQCDLAISSRCSYVGVGGSVMHSDMSWASSEFGLMSDPQNMLDALVVKVNGDVLWASEEPDLLWALRGGGAGFGG